MTDSKKSTKNDNKHLLSVVAAVLICVVAGFGIGVATLKPAIDKAGQLAPLPAGELSEGMRGTDYGIDKNINEQTIDNYLGRSDTVYRLMLPLEDTATWENKGGTRNIEKYVEGFEVVPYPLLTEFPEAYIAQKESENVHNLYQGKTLFSLDEDENYIPNYEEAMTILEVLFPKDKNIILMCGAGGYANFTKKMLVKLGWDENKIYNAGGVWFYEGNHKVEVKYKNEAGEEKFAFWKIAYHDIDFDELTKIKKENK